MGRTNESKQVSKDMTNQYNTSQQSWSDYNSRFNPLITDARTRATDLYNKTKDYYTNFLSGLGKGSFLPSDENIARMRGNGVFDEFAKTGGYSESDKAALRSRGNASIGSFYDGLKNELIRSRALNGGSGAGFDTSMQALARQQAQGASQLATNTDADIIDKVNQGREWGAGNLSQAEMAVEAAIRQGKEFDSSQQLAGISGLEDLYKAAPGEVSMYENLLQRGMEDKDTSGANLLNMRASYTPNGNWFDRNRRLLGIMGAVASAFFPQIAPVAKAVASGSDTSYTPQSSTGFNYGPAGPPPAGGGGQYG